MTTPTPAQDAQPVLAQVSDEWPAFEAAVRKMTTGEPLWNSPAGKWAWWAWQARALLAQAVPATEPVAWQRRHWISGQPSFWSHWMELHFDHVAEFSAREDCQVRPLFAAPAVAATPMRDKCGAGAAS